MKGIAPKAACLVLAGLLTAFAVACGGDDGNGGGGDGEGSEVASSELPEACGEPPAFQMPKQDPRGALEDLNLPEDVMNSYDGFPGTIFESAYKDFDAPSDPPWTVGFSESFSGNTWRQLVQETLRTSVEEAKKEGLVDELIFLDSNLDNQTQIQHIRSMMQQGADIIFTIANSPTGLNGVIKDAYDEGIPVVTVGSYVTSPYAINVGMNYYKEGQNMATGIVQDLDGQGNVIMVNGISGAPGSIQYEEGADPVFEACPDINVVTRINGEWDNATARTEMQRALATNPEEINGVWTQGSMERGVIQALQQTGRPIDIVMSNDTQASFLGFWNENQDQGFRGVLHEAPPRGQMRAAFEVGMRVMQGQGLEISVITYSAGPKTELEEYLHDDTWTLESDDVAESEPGQFLGNEYLDNFFDKPKPVLPDEIIAEVQG